MRPHPAHNAGRDKNILFPQFVTGAHLIVSGIIQGMLQHSTFRGFNGPVTEIGFAPGLELSMRITCLMVLNGELALPPEPVTLSFSS